MPDSDNAPVTGSSASHWGTKDPAAEPSRDLIAGIGRMVQEAKTRLGAGAGPAEVHAELTARGLTVDPAAVERCFADPYCSDQFSTGPAADASP